jgi:hypothetical protein
MRKLHNPMILSLIKHRAVRLTHKIQGKQAVHFLHIGKTGGSAIKYVVKQYSKIPAIAFIFIHMVSG